MLHSTHTSNHDKNNSDKKHPRHLPQEWPEGQERFTEEITARNPADRARNVIAIDHMELIDSPERQTATYKDPFQADFSRNAAELYESETSPDPGLTYSERTAKQTCDYHEGNKATPDNNLFFEERSNPLSSKGN